MSLFEPVQEGMYALYVACDADQSYLSAIAAMGVPSDVRRPYYVLYCPERPYQSRVVEVTEIAIYEVGQ